MNRKASTRDRLSDRTYEEKCLPCYQCSAVATVSYLIPGTSHVLDVDESSYNENILMSCSSEAVYMYHICKTVL